MLEELGLVQLEDGRVIDPETGEEWQDASHSPEEKDLVAWTLRSAADQAHANALDSEIKRLTAKKKALLGRIEWRLSVIRPYLQDAARRRMEEFRVKTTQVGAIDVKVANVAPAFEVTDEYAALQWARDNAPDLVKVEHTLKKTDAKKAAKDGLAVPGVTLSEGGERWSFTVEGAKK